MTITGQGAGDEAVCPGKGSPHSSGRGPPRGGHFWPLSRTADPAGVWGRQGDSGGAGGQGRPASL